MLPFGHIGINFIVINSLSRINTKRKVLYLLVGSMLPDIIDKPLGFIIFGGFGNGRLIAHTLIFNISLLLVLIILSIKKNKRDILIIPAASFLHLIEDEMWKFPKILFYPFLGEIPLKPVIPLEERLRRILLAYTNTKILVADIIGAIVIIIMIYKMLDNVAESCQNLNRKS